MKGNKNMSKKLGAVILAIIVAIAFAPLISAQLQMADSFGVDDASAIQGTNVLVPVNITSVTNGPIQTLCFDVLYDHGIIELVALQAGDLTPIAGGWMHTLGSNHESITVTTFQSANAIPNGSTGSVVLLNFSIIGDPHETSSMNMDSIDFSNTNLQHGTAPPMNGTFEVLPIPMADEFGVNNASGAQGTNVLVPVNIVNTKNGPIQTMCFDVLYNHSIIDLVYLREGNLTPVAGGWMHTLGSNHESITITTFQSVNAIPNGSTNSIVFLNFSIIGEPGEMSNMNISNLDMSNTQLQHGIAPITNGTFTIEDIFPPKISNVQDHPDPQEINGWVNITCDVTDNVGVDKVKVNITGPLGFTPINVSMNEGSYYYNATYAIPGTYNYFIWANDTSGNENHSTMHTFLIISPVITFINISPPSQSVSSGDTFTLDITIDPGEPIRGAQADLLFDPSLITVNSITDGGMFDMWFDMNLEIDNINGSIRNIVALSFENVITPGVFAVIEFTAGSIDGTSPLNLTDVIVGHPDAYPVNITINNGSVTIILEDTTPPEIIDNTLSDAYTGDPFTFNATVTDNIGVSNVYVYYWYGTANNVSMIQIGATDYYEKEITIPSDSIATLHYNISAVDVVGNWAQTGQKDVTVTDNDPPIITDNTPTTATTGDPFTFNATVTDNIGVSNVYVYYWYGTANNVSMIQIGATDYYEKEITIPSDSTATLHYNISAVDAVGNWAQTSQKDVTVGDNDPPIITDNTPTTATTGDTFTFNATVTDNIQVSTVWVEYWYGTGNHTNVSMNNVADNYWEKEITIPSDSTATLHYIISANDTSNNWNDTGIKDVTIYPAWDTNMDGSINILDLIIVGGHWEETGDPGWIRADVKKDGEINVLDLIPIGQHWTG